MPISRLWGFAPCLLFLAVLFSAPAYARKDPIAVTYDKALDCTNYTTTQTFEKKRSNFFSLDTYKTSLSYIVNFVHSGQTPRPVNQINFALARKVVQTGGISHRAHKLKWDQIDTVAFVAGGRRFNFSIHYDRDLNTNNSWLTGFSSDSWEKLAGTITVEDFKALATASEVDYSLLNGDDIVDTGHMDDRDLNNLRAIAAVLPVGSTSIIKDSLGGLPVGETMVKTQDDPLTQARAWLYCTKIEADVVISVALKEHPATDKTNEEKRNVLFSVAKQRDKIKWQGMKLVIRVGDDLHEYPVVIDNISKDGGVFETALVVMPVTEFNQFVTQDKWIMRIGDDLSDTITLAPAKVKCITDAEQKLQELYPALNAPKADAASAVVAPTPATASPASALQPQTEPVAK